MPRYFESIFPTAHLRNRAQKLQQFAKDFPSIEKKDLVALFDKVMDSKTQSPMSKTAGVVQLRLRRKIIHRQKPKFELQGAADDQIKQVMRYMRLHCKNMADDALLQRIEHLLYLSFLIMSAKDNVERLKHIGSFFVFTSSGSIIKESLAFLEGELTELFPPGHLLQGDLRDMLDNWDRANESPLATKLRAVASYCMAFSLLEKWGLHSGFAEVVYAEFRVQKESKKVTSFVYAILDVVEFVLSRAKICYDTGTLAPLFHNSSTYLDWYAQVDEVKLMSRMRVGMEVSGFKQADYFKLLESVINKGETLVKFGKTIQDRKVMQGILSELKILRHESMIEGTVSKTREMPFAALVFGDSSIGKSTITEILGKQYARVTGLDYDPSVVYYRSSFDQYMSGYNSSKWMIVLDDIACLEPSKCTNGDLSIIDAIQLINCAPYLSNQAELEKKGKVPVLAKLVIANSNVKNLNVFHYFSHPSAVQRRFQCVITPYVREEFRKMGKNGPINALDGIKAAAWQEQHPPIDGSEQTPDFWEFEITEWLPAPVGKEKSLAIEHKPFAQKLSVRQMLSYFEKKVLEHLSAQATMVKNVDGLRSAKVCGLCHCDRQFCADRETHKQHDDVMCTQCRKQDCMYLHDCEPCAKCAMPNARCRCQGRQLTNQAILAQVAEQHQLQGDEFCAKCGYADCLWLGENDGEVNSTCTTCHHCISDEDLQLGECVWCLVKARSLQYELQGYVSTLTPILLMVTVGLLSHRMMTPTVVRSWGGSAYSATSRVAAAIEDRVESAVDSVQRNLGFARVAHNVYHHWWNVRQTVERAGAHAKEVLSSRSAFVVFGVIIAAIVAVKSVVKFSESFFLQGELKTAPESVDPWKRSKYRLSQLDVGDSVHNMRQYTREKFHEMLVNNMLHLVVKTDVKSVRCEALCVADRYYIMNAHNLPKSGEFSLDIFRSAKMEGVDENLDNVKMNVSMVTFLEQDVAIVFIPHIPPRKNIVELFAAKTYQANTHGFYSYKNMNGTALLPVKNVRCHMASHLGVDAGKPFPAFESRTDEETFVGLCGSPLVAETTIGMAVLGFHVMGNGNSAISTRVTVETLRKFFETKQPIDVGTPELQCSVRKYELQGLHNSSVFNFIEKGCVSEYGSLKGHHSSPKSHVARTIIAQYLIDHEGFKETHTAPVLKGWGPWRLAALPMSKKEFNLPYHNIKESVDDYFECVTLRCTELHLLQKVSEEVAINGEEGVRGVDRIDMSTSAGFPFNKMKEYFFESNEHGFKKWVPREELRELLDRSEQTYREGKRNNFVFMGALKDEPREFKKVAEKNTRVFMGQNVAHLILGRKYFLSFIRVMQRNRLDFECAIGTNAHSQDWDDIARYLFDFSEHLFDGDYSKYDKEMMAFVIMCIFDGIIQFQKTNCTEITEEDVRIMRGIAYDIAFAFVNFNGDLVSFLRNNPSGHLLTVIINSICGSVYLRFGFMQATGRKVVEFREYVRPVTYGDDVVVAVHPKVRHEFNFTTYQAALAKYGMKFTPASKDGDAYLFRHKSELDFLKRSFVVHAELGRYVAPLAMTSIYKSLVTGVASNSITAEKQIVQVMSSAWREAYMHGRDVFDQFAALVQRIIEHHNLSPYVGKNDFPSYGTLTKYYLGDGSTAWALEDPIDFSKYELQGEGDRFRFETTGTAESSYCLQGKIDIQQENGHSADICTGAPQNPHHGKDKLKSNVETSCAELVKDARDQKQTANHYETNEAHTSQGAQEQISLHMKVADQVNGELSKTGKDVKRQAEFNTGIGDFLRRPVEIRSEVLTTELTNVYYGNLFAEWITNPEVRAKMQNYAFIRGTMCMRVQIDGSSFAYGGLLVNIAPGEDVDGKVASFGTDALVYHSQKQSAIVDFARNVDAELKAQLLMPTEWVRIAVGQTASGGLHAYHILPIFNPQLATGGSAKVGMRVYAWMEDVEVHGATAYTLQGDVTIHAKQNLASSQRGYADVALERSSLEPGAFLPTTESIMELLQTNPIVHSFDWDQTATSNKKLASYGVNPEIRAVDKTKEILFTHPLAVFSRYFQYWRGSIKFTFKVFSSPHHAGTIRLDWDPIGAHKVNDNLKSTDGNMTSVMTKLWNIRESDTCEFVVPHDNHRAWFNTRVGRDWVEQGFSTPEADGLKTYPVQMGVHNGNLNLRVFTPLNSPISTSTVRIIMQLSVGEDFEFAQMCYGSAATSYQLQGDETLYMGENFMDLKKVLSRPSMVYLFTRPVGGSGQARPGPGSAVIPLYPPLSGYTEDGAWSCRGHRDTSKYFQANAVRQTLLARLIDAHVGVAGSTKWLVSVTGTGVSTSSLGYGPAQEIAVPTAGIEAKIVAASTIDWDEILLSETAYESGREIFNPRVNPIHEVRIPSYSPYRFIPYNKVNKLAPMLSYDTDFTDDNAYHRLAVSAGPDLKLVRFRGFQPQYLYPSKWIITSAQT